MDLVEMVKSLSYLQKAFLMVSLEYDSEGHTFHLGKCRWLFAIPQACISIGLLWTAADETVRTTNLISVIRNANVWMEALLSIIYNVHNTYAEWRLSGPLRYLLTFNEERRTMSILKSVGSKVKRLTRCAIAVCFVCNALAILQWTIVGDTWSEVFKHLLIEVPNLIDNILITKWFIYVNFIAAYSKYFLENVEDIQAVSNVNFEFDKGRWNQLCCDYSRIHFIYREIVECFGLFLVVFVVCQYMRLLWMLYVLAENFILGSYVEFHAVFGTVVQIFSLCCVVLPCLWIRQAANDVGRACSRIYTGREAHMEVLNFQFQILVQDYNVPPHGAMELNGTLITSIFSTMFVYLVLLIQMARL